jgi:hypothetical protein
MIEHQKPTFDVSAPAHSGGGAGTSWAVFIQGLVIRG